MNDAPAQRIREMQEEIHNYEEIDCDSEDIRAVKDNITSIIENYNLKDRIVGFFLRKMYI